MQTRLSFRVLLSTLLLGATVLYLQSCNSSPGEYYYEDDEEWEEFDDIEEDAAFMHPPKEDPDDLNPADRHSTHNSSKPPQKRHLAIPAPKTSREVQEIFDKLKGPSPVVANKAFWSLTEIRKDLIPELLFYIEDEDLTAITELKILVRDANFQGFWVSHIPGMGVMEKVDKNGETYWEGYDRFSSGIADNRKGFKVKLIKSTGFPLGVVIRAAMLNRFRSLHYPRGIDHMTDLRRWWNAYYKNAFRSRR